MRAQRTVRVEGRLQLRVERLVGGLREGRADVDGRAGDSLVGQDVAQHAHVRQGHLRQLLRERLNLRAAAERAGVGVSKKRIAHYCARNDCDAGDVQGRAQMARRSGANARQAAQRARRSRREARSKHTTHARKWHRARGKNERACGVYWPFFPPVATGPPPRSSSGMGRPYAAML